MKIYLCGPINGCTDEECKDWREAAKKRFPDTLDPMRRDYRGRESECVAEIVELDKKDIDECDCLLVNHPKPSVGTAMEVLYAWERAKFIVVVVPKGDKLSPWMIYHSDFVVESFEEAYKHLEDIKLEKCNHDFDGGYCPKCGVHWAHIN
jgi:nucleoside 2-deoxyribosyltransferase